MNRRNLLGLLLFSLFAGLILPACGSSNDTPSSAGGGNDDEDEGDDDNNDDEETPPAACSTDGAEHSTITSNHGHSLTVPQADIDAGTAKTYNIQGSSGHNHTIDLTAGDFNNLSNGSDVVVVSSTDSAHNHSVTVTCA